MKKTIFLFIFLSACAKTIDSNISAQNSIFNTNLSFNEFISKLDDYVKNSIYPNLNE